jgi:hypothetical protein
VLRPPLAAAVALALLAPAAAAQDPAAELADIVVEAATPQNSVISGQYPDVTAVVDEVVAAVPATPSAPPPAPPAAVEPAPAPPVPQQSPQQYHSETSDVTVTQQQPANVNVSIRVNSPGDDGPVVQVNGSSNVVVVHAPAKPDTAAPGRPAAPGARGDAPPAAGVPDDWEWVWTSACFGGAGQAAAAAAAAGAGPGWTWRWSCDEAGDPARAVADGIAGSVEDLVGGPVEDLVGGPVQDLVGGPVPTATAVVEALFGAGGPAAAAAPPARRGRAAPRERRAAPARALLPATPARAAAPLAPAAATLAAARTPGAAAARAAAAVGRAVQAQARSGGRGAPLLFPPGAGGPAAGVATGLGTASALALGAWIAVLMSAIVIVLPRLRPRRWSGPSRRPPQPPSSRRERPG